MAIYNVKLIGKKEVASGTAAFIFEKPEGFAFKAGQFGDFTLFIPEKSNSEGEVHRFSFTNPPFEKELMITTRLRNSNFKRILNALKPGISLKLNAPHGSFTLHNKKDIPAVFLTGGIGITPVRSIVMQAAKDKLSQELFLFYSNHRPEDTAFLEELKTLKTENTHYHFIPTMTEMNQSKQDWQGELGYITKKMLSKYIHDLTKPIYYVSGLPAMVSAMHQMLNEAGIDDDSIRIEEFPGY